MIALIKKEISVFFSSVTGYLVWILFLVLTGLFVWVFPGNLNVLDSGYAHLDTLFYIGPWVFLFLVPAITMRSFAEEKRTGTLELLFTFPLTDIQVILAKYLAGVLLVLLCLLPTVIYYFSVSWLASPSGNVDTGGVVGSYIGLFLLACAFVGMGIFASAITQNQIISFLVAVLICFLVYFGFDQVATLVSSGSTGRVLQNFGASEHYLGLSRGVIDSRDVIYFIACSLVFLALTRFVLESRKW